MIAITLWHWSGTIWQLLEEIGLTGAGVAVLYGGLRWMTSIFKKAMSTADSLEAIQGIEKNVQTILDNHLPHIHMEVTEARQNFVTLRDDIKGLAGSVADLDTKVTVVATKQEITTEAMHRLGQAFLNHVDRQREL